MRPPGGSGVSRVTPASSSVRLLTHCMCWLSSNSATGRPGTTASSAAAVISLSGTAAGPHPQPRIAGISGWSAAKRATAPAHCSIDLHADRSTSKTSQTA